MPVNRNALIRFRTIDNCLKNRHRRWTLEDLIDACSEALYEYEGIEKGVSRRSVQMDLQMMRSDKLGYNAPIVVVEKKYYTYEDPDYSITNIPLTEQDLGKLTEVVGILRQFKGFSHFQELSGMVQRLENKIHSEKTHEEPVIDFERNDSLKGLEHIDTIYQAIVSKKCIDICYQSFKAREPSTFSFHPYYLKEYRNRWFVIGIKQKDKTIMNLALDRIVTIEVSAKKYIPRTNFTISSLLHNVIGVSVNVGGTTEHVVFIADHQTAPYIVTKPLHHSQQIVERLPEGVVFSIDVQLNFELERELLGFGDRIKVIAPERLRRTLKFRFNNALDQYEHDFNPNTLQNNIQKLKHKGFCTIHKIFRKKEVNAIKLMLHNRLQTDAISEIPGLREIIMNSNMRRLIQKIGENIKLINIDHFDRMPEGERNWKQDASFNGFVVRIYLDDIRESNGALKVISGSQNKKLSNKEINLITQNSSPVILEVDAGDVVVVHSMLLHASSKPTDQKHRRVIHLELK